MLKIRVRSMRMFFQLLSVLIVFVFINGCSKESKSGEENSEATADERVTSEMGGTDAEVIQDLGVSEQEGGSQQSISENEALQAYLEGLKVEWKEAENPLTATFIGSEMGDYFHLVFEDANGKRYDFGNGKNELGDISLFDEETLESNSSFVGKQFKIRWDWKLSSFSCCEGQMNPVEAEVPSIVNIEPLNE
ncbi:hypothetical protein [Xanthovirga aplysinae]|uniref:hypothetical protein n=1 Tax=Xanthovirga aplysinae TaxID=2529853 RepID=UPI0012BD171B|nr:hypothetical protein [Xanthovirga aplysinae]MTI30279.1 hypothetical protein [Xanthovirga aplysinae]